MDMDDRYIELLKSIIIKTNEDNAIWKDTSTSDQYALYLDSGSIIVDYYQERNHPEYGSQPEGYGVTIINRDGVEIEDIKRWSSEGGEAFDIIRDLYHTAKRSFLKVDETIDGMIEEVENKDRVGRREEQEDTFEPDDDLPF
jgi:hypothetical protein